MTSTTQFHEQFVEKFPIDLAKLLNPAYSHRYCHPDGRLRSIEDILQNETFWKNLGPPALIKVRP